MERSLNMRTFRGRSNVAPALILKSCSSTWASSAEGRRMYSSTPWWRISCSVKAPACPRSRSAQEAWTWVTWRTSTCSSVNFSRASELSSIAYSFRNDTSCGDGRALLTWHTHWHVGAALVNMSSTRHMCSLPYAGSQGAARGLRGSCRKPGRRKYDHRGLAAELEMIGGGNVGHP